MSKKSDLFMLLSNDSFKKPARVSAKNKLHIT